MLFHKCAKNSICSTTVGNATVIPGSDTYYKAVDQIRSSRVLLDANGNLDQKKDYSPYGKGDGGHGALSKYLFSGKSKPGAEIPMHRENRVPVACITLASGIIEAQRRSGSQPGFDCSLTDDPTLGRWLSTDPVPEGKPAGSGQFHSPYVYAGNNPLVMVDPNGEIGIFALAWQAYQYFSYASMAFQIASSTAKGGFGGFIDATTQIGFSMGIGGFVGGIANFGPTLGARISSGVVSGSIAGGVTSSMFGGSFGIGALYGGVSGGIAGGLAYGAEMNSVNRASQQQNIDPDDPWTGSPEELIEKYDRLKQIHAKAGDPQIKEATSWNIHKPRYALLDNGLIMDKKTGSRWVWGYTNHVGKRVPLRNGWYGWRSQIRIAPATFMKSTRWSVMVLGHELAHATMNFNGTTWYLARLDLEHRMEDYAHHWERVTARYYGWNTYY